MRAALSAHEVTEAIERGWDRISSGELLWLAEDAGFDLLLRFHVLFQCKRYKGSVSSSEMRDFRGAMVGRSDKGLFITTGTFTPAAVKEATRDGAPAIDLIDGGDLAEKLKELRLGVSTSLVEVVAVEDKWFETL